MNHNEYCAAISIDLWNEARWRSLGTDHDGVLSAKATRLTPVGGRNVARGVEEDWDIDVS
jgi:hypothetical protein